jgi:hypothetical protein
MRPLPAPASASRSQLTADNRDMAVINLFRANSHRKVAAHGSNGVPRDMPGLRCHGGHRVTQGHSGLVVP